MNIDKETALATHAAAIAVTEVAFIMIKPDAVKDNAVGDIVSVFETNGFSVERLVKVELTPVEAMLLYREHVGKPFFKEHIRFILSGPVVAIALASYCWGEYTWTRVREICGATDPSLAMEGTIRKKYGSTLPMNAIHASENRQLALLDASIFFQDLVSLPAAALDL